jgi:hypothetical protein
MNDQQTMAELVEQLQQERARRAAAENHCARLRQEAQAHARELAVLGELSQSLVARLTVEQVLEEAHRGVARVLEATDFYISFYDPAKNEVTFPIEVMNGQVTHPY